MVSYYNERLYAKMRAFSKKWFFLQRVNAPLLPPYLFTTSLCLCKNDATLFMPFNNDSNAPLNRILTSTHIFGRAIVEKKDFSFHLQYSIIIF